MAVLRLKGAIASGSKSMSIAGTDSLVGIAAGDPVIISDFVHPFGVERVSISQRIITLDAEWVGDELTSAPVSVTTSGTGSLSGVSDAINTLLAETQKLNNSQISIESLYQTYVNEKIVELQSYIDLGQQPFNTLSELQAAGEPSVYATVQGWNVDNFLARVVFDSTKSNNGLYAWNGSAWQKSEFDSVSEMEAQLAQAQQIVADLPTTVNDALAQAGMVQSTGDPLAIVDASNILAPLDRIRFAFTDGSGNSALMFTELGEVIAPLLRSKTITTDSVNAKTANIEQLLLNGAAVDTDEYNYAFAIADDNGNVIQGVLDGESLPTGGEETAALQARDAANISKSQALKSVVSSEWSGTHFNFNKIVVLSQSLGTGAEGWPHLSRTQSLGNVMIGDDPRQRSTSVDSYTPVGSIAFNPLVAATPQGSTLLSDSEIAALTPGDGTKGEHSTVGMCNMAKSLWNRHFNHDHETDHVFVAAPLGQGGRNITQISKNNTSDSVNRYNWFLESLGHMNTLSGANTWGVTGIVFMQGEDDYVSELLSTDPLFDGPLQTKALYKAALVQLHSDAIADSVAASGQSKAPAFITYQTGGNYTRDLDKDGNPGLYVGMAQLEFVEETTGAFMAGPVYPYSDKGGHLDANGYRWFGNKLGQVYHRVVTLGQDWMPVRPVSITQIDEHTIDVDFHVPEPPLQFKAPYVGDYSQGASLPLYPAKGFSVTDDDGGVGVASVELIGQTIVRITTTKNIGANPHVWYADKANHGGNGNLCDSDKTVAFDSYEYRPEWGMYSTANRPEFVNKKYPLENWAVAFYLPVGYQLANY